ncbi:MAG: VCBS repeat-containing protein [Verrucomicrobia bacterium]|nr:VCBS repeat-containing protein [Verrucomicrobiota bacterium]
MKTCHLLRTIAVIFFLGLAPTGAFIECMYSLQEILDECTHVAAGKLTRVDAGARTVVAELQRPLKGKAEYKQVNMNIALGPAHHAKYVIDRMSADAPVILFYKRESQNIAALVHAGDLWFQLYATDETDNRDKVWWRFTHVEPTMGRTFDGTTPDLIKLVAEVVAKRVPAPKPDPAVTRLDLNRPAPAKTPSASSKPGGLHRQVTMRLGGSGEVRGVSILDVNGDELPDIFLCRQDGNVLLLNQGDSFKDAAREYGIAKGSRAAAWADYNGDDHPDLLTDNFNLYTHVGGKMRDTSALLRAPAQRNTEGAGWIDHNGDGWPDILISNAEQGIRLFENTGKGPDWFREVSDQAGLGLQGLGAGNGDFIVCFDYDGDGYTDFFYNLGDGVLAQNQGKGKFRLDTRSGLKIAGGSSYKRGLAVADFDNDDDLDVFVPGPGRPQLYRNNNDGKFTDIAESAGDLAKVNEPSFAAAWGDVNGDGFLDLFICHPQGPGRLFIGDGKGRFSDLSKEAGVDKLSPAYAAVFADLDDDGDLDLVVHLQDRAVVAFNDLPRAPDRRPVTVRVRERKGAIGAVVRVQDAQGRLLGSRELNGAESCGGQAVPLAYFHVPLEAAQISVALSNGQGAQSRLPKAEKAGHQAVVFSGDQFK